MPESDKYSLIQNLRRPEMAAFVAGLALGAAFIGDAVKTALAAENLPGLERCYDQPDATLTANFVPSPPPKDSYAYAGWEHIWYQQNKIRDEQNAANKKPLNLRATKRGIIGDPHELLPSVDNKIQNSVVEVRADGWQGSGVLAEDATGREVVITAAHVTRHVPINLIKIIDIKGNSTGVSGGCYMFEGNGKFDSPARILKTKTIDKKDKGKDKKKDEKLTTDAIDVAVLRLNKKIGLAALNLAAEQPAKGDWVFFKNYQTGAHQGEPLTYGGVVAENFDWPPTFTVLSGLQYWRGTGYSIKDGASGGPVVNRAGQLVGISVGGASDSPGSYQNKTYLKSEYNLTISGINEGRKTGLIPKYADIIPVEALRLALKSPRA